MPGAHMRPRRSGRKLLTSAASALPSTEYGIAAGLSLRSGQCCLKIGREARLHVR
jgi:hypothetical protein